MKINLLFFSKNKISWLLVFFILVVMAGCKSAPKSQEEVGTVNVSVTVVAPWEEYIASLSPNFDLSADAALNKVIPRTGITEEKILDALGFSARVGLPQTSDTITRTRKMSSTKAVGGYEEESSDVSERVGKKEPGQLPDTPSKSQADRSIKDLPGIPDSLKTIRNDPMLEYTAATALFQEVQLLNRYVKDAALKHNMDAYVVRLQLGVVPFRREMGYDIYTKIGFFPKDANGKTEHKAVVLPLLVTDNLEGTLASHAQDTIRQFSLALSYMQAGIVGALGLDRYKEIFESELFTEPNSLFTIGRVTDNTLGARFGAVRQGSKKFSIIPRTHNVTLLLMVDKGFAVLGNNKKIRVVTRTLMRSVIDGKQLAQQEQDGRIRHVEEAILARSMNGRLYDSIKFNRWCINTNKDPGSDILSVPCTQAMLDAIWANDFLSFERVLKEAGWTNHVGRFTRDLWMDIVESLDKSHYSGAFFELPNSTKLNFPLKQQLVLLLDDGKSKMRATLLDGAGLVPDRLRAVLNLQFENGKIVPIIGTILPESTNTDLVIDFPSLSLLKMDKFDREGSWLELRTVISDRWNDNGKATESQSYGHVKYHKLEDSIKPVFSLTRTTSLIKPDTRSKGTISIFVELEKDDKKKPLANQVEFRVDGADLASAQFMERGKAGKESRLTELGKVIVATDGTLVLKLSNLDKSNKVIIKSVAKDKAGKNVGGDHPNLEYEVSESAPASDKK